MVALGDEGNGGDYLHRFTVVAFCGRGLFTSAAYQFIRRCATFVRGRCVVRRLIGVAGLVYKGRGHLVVQRPQYSGLARLTFSKGVRSIHQFIRRRGQDVHYRYGTRGCFFLLTRKGQARISVRVRFGMVGVLGRVLLTGAKVGEAIRLGVTSWECEERFGFFER